MKTIFTLLLLLVLFAVSCQKTEDPTKEKEVTPPDNQVIVSKNISTGSYTSVATGSVGTSGATIKVSKPGTPVDGVELTVPANSFSSSQAVSVSYAEIKNHQFGPNFLPISPVISISCGGEYAKEPISLTIPVKIPSGHIPLGFYLDETNGKLEGIPFASIGANSITLLTRHFLSASQLKSGSASLKSGLTAGASIIISSISESLLTQLSTITSGYKPGVDDWEFVNYGSYIAYGGHCAGQNMAAMWYFYEKKPTLGSLYNKYSDNSKLWQDNAKGYRFCSVLHNDLIWDGTVSTLFSKYIDKNQELDKQKLLTIAGAMLVTGEPQGIGVYSVSGTNPNGTTAYSGHDLICYQLSVNSGKLYISDPNTPGVEQTISFANNKFQPYVAKANGNTPPSPYPYVTYYAKTAFIEWNKIGKRFDELVNNTIGTVAPNVFPAYTIWYKDKTSDLELKDGITVSKDTLKTYVECPAAANYALVNGKRVISSTVFGVDGTTLSKQNVPGVKDWGLSSGLYVKLSPGLNKLGYNIIGWNSQALFDKSTEKIPLYVDFKWITVNYSPLAIDPNPLQGVANKEYTFIARSKGTAPKTCKFTWDFGDGNGTFSIQNDSIVTHSFSKEGNFNIGVKLYDSSNKLISEATSQATIKPAIPAPEISLISMGKATIGNDSVLIAGDVLYLSGYNFGPSKTSNSKVLFNGKEATTYVSWSQWEINVRVPFGATSGNVEVVVENQKSNGKPVQITDIWKYIVQSNRFDYKLNNVRINYKNSKGVSDFYTIYDLTDPDVKPTYSISGSKLMIDYKYQPNANRTRTVKIEGTFSEDGTTITNLKYDEVDVVYPNTKYQSMESISFVITDLTLLYWMPKLTSLTIQYFPVNGNTTYLKGKLTNFKYSFKDSSSPELNNIENIVSVDSSTADFILGIGK
jgi:hypothetical protein